MELVSIICVRTPRRSGEFPLIAVNIEDDIFGELLADPRVDPNQVDSRGRSPLMIAVDEGDVDRGKTLLRCPKVRWESVDFDLSSMKLLVASVTNSKNSTRDSSTVSSQPFLQ